MWNIESVSKVKSRIKENEGRKNHQKEHETIDPRDAAGHSRDSREKCNSSLKAGERAGMGGNKREVFLNTLVSDLFNSLHLSGEKCTG